MLLTEREIATMPTQLFQFSKDEKEFAQQGQKVQKWIDALKSGEYKKNTSDRLKDTEGYSALGVAQHVCNLGPGLSEFRLSEYRSLGLSNSAGGCTDLLLNVTTDNFYNSILELPSYVTFEAIAGTIEKRFELQIRTHRFWLQLMECNIDLNLFDRECVSEQYVEDNVKTWLNALRQDAHQTTGILKRYLFAVPGEEVVGYCCLGLADTVCKLAETCPSTLEHKHTEIGLYDMRGDFNVPPVCMELFRDIKRQTYEHDGVSLALMNDTYGWTFSMIADFVERQFVLAKLACQEENTEPSSSVSKTEG